MAALLGVQQHYFCFVLEEISQQIKSGSRVEANASPYFESVCVLTHHLAGNMQGHCEHVIPECPIGHLTRINTCSGCHWKVYKCYFMKQNCHLLRGVQPLKMPPCYSAPRTFIPRISTFKKRYTAESKTNRSLGSVWSKISTFHMGLVFSKVIPRPGLVQSSKPLLRPLK